jgi:hypothetical protein
MTRAILATLLAATALTAVPAHAQASAPALEDAFRAPPSSARPRVWWHWMNGNVTKDGIDKDLDWMARIGIGGVQNFDANLATPQIIEKRLVYMDEGWKAAFKHAVEQADRKGLEFAIAASPGWSETGGPWVKPEDGMKKLVWGETIVPGGKRFTGKIATPPTHTGPFQDADFWDPIGMLGGEKPAQPPRASGAVGVYAVPVSAEPLPAPSITRNDGQPITGTALQDASLSSAVKLDGKGTPSLVLDYGKPVTVQSGRLYLVHGKHPFGDPAFTPVLEAEVAGQWSPVSSFAVAETPSTIRFAPVTAQRFRLVFGPYQGKKRIMLGEGAPGAEDGFNIAAMLQRTEIELGDFALSGEARVHQAEDKAGYGAVTDFYAIARNGVETAKPAAIDLSAFVKADGTLDWKAPKGSSWRIYSFGWSLTGKTNHPATKEATGLEVDKFDPAAIRRYLETYLGMYRETVGADLIGKRGIRALLTDSIEVGFANWTPAMPREFKVRRGYDLGPWLPALAGEVIGSEDQTEKFLYDYRRTLAELVADQHYGTVAKVAHEHGLTVYGEALEDTRPMLGDDLAMRKHADVPMAALWTWNRGFAPRPTLLGDMKGASSVAHVYGQNLVAAESMTSAGAPWAFAPKDLKRIIDLEFAHGINRPVIHTSVHQPVDDKQPGLSLMIFGQYFNRHEVWADLAKPWVDYMARTSFLLQQGRNHADVAAFTGEEAPLTAQFAYGVPDGLPKSYAYDFINADMLTSALSVQGSDIVATGGARYKAIFLHGSSHRMTLPTLRRLATMVEAGATLIGEKPQSSPALKDDAAAFTALADRLWTSSRVIATKDVEAGMAKAGNTPDFQYSGTHPAMGKADILFVHRKLADGDAYWINNRSDKAVEIRAQFGVFGRNAEIWDPVTGARTPIMTTPNLDGKTTTALLALRPEDAKFVVFRGNTVARVEGKAVILSKEATISTDDGKPVVLFPAPPSPLMTTEPWTVSFQPGRGAPASAVLKTLLPLNDHASPGIKYFSGIATYKVRFTPPKGMKPGQSLQLDLGEVGDLADVRVNGQAAGTLWLAPYRLDIGKLVKPGVNTLEVRVANTWVNRLIGDKQPGAAKVTFTAAPTYKPDAPLRRSGLIGPVTLSAE